MADSRSSISVVLVTEFTTVRPTYSVVVVTDYTTVYTTNTPTSTDAPCTSSASTPISQVISASSSVNIIPPVSSSPPEKTCEPKFNDTFAYVVLILVMLVGALLLTMLISMVYLRWRGKCPDCESMRKQIEKWETGEQKPITPAVVRQREAINKSLSQSTALAELDLERGDRANQAFPAGRPNFQAESNPSIQKMIKRKPLPNAGASTFTKYGPYSDFNDSFRAQPNPTQVYDEQNGASTSGAYRNSVSWSYSQPAENQHIDGGGGRVFADVPIFAPNPYAAYVTDEDGFNHADIREQKIYEAETSLQSDAYKRAEMIMRRASASDSVIRRATSIVNLADQRLNIARHPSLYSEFCQSEEAKNLKNEPEEYQMIEWRKRGKNPPNLDDELYFYS